MPPIRDLRPLRANVLGIGISATNVEEALDCAERLITLREKGYICATGVHGIMEAQEDEDLRSVLNRSFLCIPDGAPTVWVGRLQGHQKMARVYGPDFMLEFCKRSAARGYRHFLYGGRDGVAERLRWKLMQRIPELIIAGVYTPPFRELTAAENDEVIEKINRSGADVVWIGISTPKQERFMAKVIRRLDCSLMVGVGAAFDIHAGLVKDSPRWMKNCGLQWLDRLRKEPQRLWKRYLKNNPKFVWEIGLQIFGWRKFEIDTS